jgi:hypothetical protein
MKILHCCVYFELIQTKKYGNEKTNIKLGTHKKKIFSLLNNVKKNSQLDIHPLKRRKYTPKTKDMICLSIYKRHLFRLA